jgi:hypothetical protein
MGKTGIKHRSRSGRARRLFQRHHHRGLLAATVKQRCREFGHDFFTPYAVELVCYDLRSDAKHSITLEIARDTQPAQDALIENLSLDIGPASLAKDCSCN